MDITLGNTESPAGGLGNVPAGAAEVPDGLGNVPIGTLDGPAGGLGKVPGPDGLGNVPIICPKIINIVREF